MMNDLRLIKCFNCGQAHRLGDYVGDCVGDCGQNTGIICTGCGKKIPK